MSRVSHRETGARLQGRHERRRSPRIDTPFPAVVRGLGFEEEATLDNLSADGLQVRLNTPPQVGARLFVLVRFTIGASWKAPGPGVAITGVVLRAEPLPDGRCAVAVLALRHRLIFAHPSA
jgi:hypothetical protein